MYTDAMIILNFNIARSSNVFSPSRVLTSLEKNSKHDEFCNRQLIVLIRMQCIRIPYMSTAVLSFPDYILHLWRMSVIDVCKFQKERGRMIIHTAEGELHGCNTFSMHVCLPNSGAMHAYGRTTS